MSIGASLPRLDALGKVTGATPYPADLRRDEFLHAKVLFTNQPHARLVNLDVSRAWAIPGVVEVLTSQDIPLNEYGLTIRDQPVLIGTTDTGRSGVAGELSRWEGDQIAVVVAETTEAALVGAMAVAAEWEQLPVLADVEQSLASDALLHPENGQDSNAYCHLKIRKGDLAAGWAAAEVVIDEVYHLPYQEHAYLQPEAAIAYIDEAGRVTVEIAGQWAHEDQEQIAHALDLAPERVRVIYPAVGGAFGGREDMSLQIVMAAAALKLHRRGIDRPIRCEWSREESIIGHHKRHRGRIHHRLGATRDGRITALEVDAVLDAGGYNYTTNKVLGNMHLTLAGPYEIPNASIDSRAVYTNAPVTGAFRGFGAPQGTFAIETQLNKLADVLGIDPVEVRLRNALEDGGIGITQVELPLGVTIKAVIEAAASSAARHLGRNGPGPSSFATLPVAAGSIRRGRGFACAYKNVGFSFGFAERCEAIIELHGDEALERAVLIHAAAEVGQGGYTAFRQMAAEALGLDVAQVETRYSDTATSGDSGSASASRLTFMVGNSILGAAEEALKRWNDGERPAVGRFRYVPPPTDVLDPETGAGQPNFCYGYVAEAVDLSVDVETGLIQVDGVVCAVETGKAINPQLVEGQIEGGVVQAHGYTVTEKVVVENGHIQNPRLSVYLIPGIGDIPTAVYSEILENPDPRGPFGARGMAEMPFIPYAPAVIAALHDATGVWFNSFPLTPDFVVAELRRHGIGEG
jgi:CO/xanthine dehydrogenase Mo-binding subunit